MLHGLNPQLIIDNIRRRAAARRAGDVAPDGRKLALVIEGGGMRSVCSGAGAAALGQLGLHDAFDEVYATSAGVMNAVYLITNQVDLGMSVYFENCTTWSFLNPFRFWKILNVDYIVDRVVSLHKPFDAAALKASPTRLLITVCDRRTGELVLIDTRSTTAPILRVLKAAMAMPVLYNRTVRIDDVGCVDGGTILPFPLLQAIERGCTDILVLQTRPAGFTELPPSRARQYVFNTLHAFSTRRLRGAFAGRHIGSQQVRDTAMGKIAPPEGVNIAAICTEDVVPIEAATTNRAVNYRAALDYGRRVFQYFDRDPDEFVLALS